MYTVPLPLSYTGESNGNRRLLSGEYQNAGTIGLRVGANKPLWNHTLAEHDAPIVASYTEVESGRKSNRLGLAKALAHARRGKARLVISKLDRFGRDVAFLAQMMESRVDFVACDNPNANSLTLRVSRHVLSRRPTAISQRTRNGIAEAKEKRGVKLGSARPNHWKGLEDVRRAGGIKGWKLAAESDRTLANAAYADLFALVMGMKDEGLSLSEIARKLTELGHRTRRNRTFGPMQVSRLIARASGYRLAK